MTTAGWIVLEVFPDGAYAAHGPFVTHDGASEWIAGVYNPNRHQFVALLVNKP